jgi:hypothetical protein
MRIKKSKKDDRRSDGTGVKNIGDGIDQSR